MKEASFQMLVDICKSNGWDKTIAELERIVFKNESLQADLFAGTPSQIRQAQKLSKMIIRQNLTIARLKEYKALHDNPRTKPEKGGE